MEEGEEEEEGGRKEGSIRLEIRDELPRRAMVVRSRPESCHEGRRVQIATRRGLTTARSLSDRSVALIAYVRVRKGTDTSRNQPRKSPLEIEIC